MTFFTNKIITYDYDFFYIINYGWKNKMRGRENGNKCKVIVKKLLGSAKKKIEYFSFIVQNVVFLDFVGMTQQSLWTLQPGFSSVSDQTMCNTPKNDIWKSRKSFDACNYICIWYIF